MFPKTNKSCKSTMVALLCCFTISMNFMGVVGRPSEDERVISKQIESPSSSSSMGNDLNEGNNSLEPKRISRSANGPQFMIKNRIQGRSSRFHEGPNGPRLTSRGLMPSSYSSPVAKALAQREALQAAEELSPQTEDIIDAALLGLSEQDPTFTPYISARVFNMPKFMEHIRGNLKSIIDEGDDFGSDEIELDDNDLESLAEYGKNGIGEAGIPQQQQEYRGYLRGAPYHFGAGRPRMSHFVQMNNPRNAYEFGLG